MNDAIIKTTMTTEPSLQWLSIPVLRQHQRDPRGVRSMSSGNARGPPAGPGTVQKVPRQERHDGSQVADPALSHNSPGAAAQERPSEHWSSTIVHSSLIENM